MIDNIVETRSLFKKYRDFTAVSDMSINVSQSSIYALVGQNGAGKTTLLKMLCGLTLPTSGDIILFSKSSGRELCKERKRIGAMIETPAFVPYLSARDNLEYLRIQRGKGNKMSAENALAFVGLSDTGRKRFSHFSLGMKQRLGLALAVMDSPELLILDEPINGLDPIGIKEFRDIIFRMNKENRTTVLISSHILSELSQIATDYGFIDHGRLLRHITAGDLKEECSNVLYFDVDDVRRASDILRELHRYARISSDNNVLRISECRDDSAVITGELTERGIAVSQVRRDVISLEEYFIELIKGGKGNV
jgi:ABC-2 type transport system ATP-binding protein